MEPTECSETSSANLIHTPCENPKTNKYSDHGQSFKTRSYAVITLQR